MQLKSSFMTIVKIVAAVLCGLLAINALWATLLCVASDGILAGIVTLVNSWMSRSVMASCVFARFLMLLASLILTFVPFAAMCALLIGDAANAPVFGRFLAKKPLISTIACSMLAGGMFFNFIGIMIYCSSLSGGNSRDFSGLLKQCLHPDNIIAIIGYGALAFLAISTLLPNLRNSLQPSYKIIWFIPGAIFALGFIIMFFGGMINVFTHMRSVTFADFGGYFIETVVDFIRVAAVTALGLWIVEPYISQARPSNNMYRQF